MAITWRTGEAKGPDTHTGRTVRERTASWTALVQSPLTFMQTLEWLGSVGCWKRENACHSRRETHGRQTYLRQPWPA